MRLPIKVRAIAVSLAMLLTVYLLLSFALVWGATQAERKPFEADPAEFGLKYEEVSFKSRGHDLRLDGWLLPARSDAPYLIVIHGIGGQRTADDAVPLAARLVALNYNVLLFDLRAHGTSEGSRVSGGFFERDDALGAYDFLVSRGAQPGRVVFIGRSMGAGIAIMAAAREPGIAALVADTPFADIDDFIAQETARKTPIPKFVVPVFLPAAGLFASAIYGIDLGELKSEADVARLAYPVLVIHGEADKRIPVSQGRRVYEHAPEGSELWTIPGLDHLDAFSTLPDEYIAHVAKYLSSRFGPPP